MPRKPFDSRILKLATEAGIRLDVSPALAPIPASLVDVPGMHADQTGYPWPWADVTLTATFGGVVVTQGINSVSCPDEGAFKRTKEYNEALGAALTQLLRRLDQACDALAYLGGG